MTGEGARLLRRAPHFKIGITSSNAGHPNREERSRSSRVKLPWLLDGELTVVVCVKTPLVPVIIRVVGPVAFAFGLAFTVIVVPFGELVGLNDAVVLGGKPLTENVTVPLNPFCLFTVTL
jgi:hypothetical protein